MTDKAKPAHKIRNRDIAVTTWKNSKDKRSWYSVTPMRRYKRGDQWKETDRFDFEDLLPLAKLLDEAHSWILAAEQAERQAASGAAMSPLLHQRLLNEATRHGTEEILQQMPAEHSPELEQAIRQGVRQAVLYYAEGLDTLSRQLRPLDHAVKARA